MKMAAILNVFLLSLSVSKTVTYTQLVNSNTIAVSSSTYPSYVASRTVDGNTDQNHTSCSHTDARSNITEAWLRIDLGTVYSVKSVKLWYRGDRGSAYYNTLRLRGYSLRMSNDTTVPPPESSCYNDPGNVTLPTIIEKDCERTARYIWIYQSNKPNNEPYPMLVICEVQVFGCETGHYGGDCSKKCVHCRNNATCGIQNGECDYNGCASPGYQPPLCKECYTGYYGEDCSKKCDHCKNNASCEKQYGECDILGCAYSGYQPPLCKGCILGMYGLHCERNCSRYCGFDDCDRKTGTCLDGCKSGYIGSFCNQTCPIGKYGPNCKEICGHCYNNSDCYHGNGTCLEGCEAGYWNYECKTLCSDGRYEQNCQYTCSGNCVNGEACDKTNGSCGSCVDGFQGSKCDRDIRQSPTDLKQKMDIEHLKMEGMMLENQKTEKEIKRLEAETEVLRVRKNVLLRLQAQLVNNKTIAVGSSTYGGYVASRAVDGNTDQDVSRCFHINDRRDITEAWLRIDLGGVNSVKSVMFWLRDDRIPTRLRGYSLRVSNDTNVPPPESSCYTDPGIVTLPTIVEEDCERTAQYIWIYQSNIPDYDYCPMFAICEVQVFGCETGHYGEDCSKKCNHCENNATCGIQNGECDYNGCASPGHQPPLCKGGSPTRSSFQRPGCS